MSLEESILVLAEAVQELAIAITTTNPPSASILDVDEAADAAQTSIEDFDPAKWLEAGGMRKKRDWAIYQFNPDAFRYYDKRRKNAMACSICGKPGYNARTHERHVLL